MKLLVEAPPYACRDETALLAELERLTEHHLMGCVPYKKMWPNWVPGSLPALPFVHVGVFKDLLLRTDTDGIKHQRILRSSATTSGIASQVLLDERSSALQAQSARMIFGAWLGTEQRPLVVLDDVHTLRGHGDVTARLAAALSLRPLATSLHFVLPDSTDPKGLRWKVIADVVASEPEVIIYGFTWVLWQAWAQGEIPASLRKRLRQTKVRFVHSGGWKKLEEARVDRATFDATLLSSVGTDSTVLDYYGLVEQPGIIFPLCHAGARHVPRWADVLVRDPWNLTVENEGTGQLQFVNPLAWGAPYHSVLTEDIGEILPGICACGREGRRFSLHGRVPMAELRGCANV